MSFSLQRPGRSDGGDFSSRDRAIGLTHIVDELIATSPGSQIIVDTALNAAGLGISVSDLRNCRTDR